MTNTRTHLNIVVEELETSNEELQSLNEELQSANEELQSTNEELQTSNEELQSTNEELLTVNEELQVKSTELERTTFDLINVKQSLDFPLIVVNTQLRITQTNSACTEIADFQNPLEGSSLNSVQWLVEIPGLYNNVHKVIRESTSSETKIHYPEKQVVFHLFIMPYRNSLNQIDGAILLFTNVSALHSVETAFAESEVKFHQAMLHAPIGIALQSPEGHYLEVNPALCEILGYTTDELLARDLQSVTHPDDLDITMDYIYRMLSNEIDSHYLDKRFIHKDGHIVWATLHKAIVRDSNNRPKYFIALIVDITSRRIAEDELRLAASVFSNAMDGIIITDNRAKIIKVNKAFENMLGYTSSDVIGQHTRILRSYRHDDEFYRAMWDQIHEKGSWTGEIWDRHKEGHIVPVWLSISALKDNAGKIDHYIAVMYDISELKQYHERMHHLAHYDGLTKLPNRMLFTDRLKHAIDIAKRSNFTLAILFVDLDNFKQINDARGHHIGDELICKVADRLSQITRSTDTVARLSGDEFVILLENQLTKDKVCMIAEKAISSISESMELSDGPAFISASIGIAFYPDDGEDMESLLQHSDLAMYRAKENGRNHFVFYQQEMSQKMHERILLKTDLHQALRYQKLQFNYQPIINIYSKEYMGAEALLRWKHPKLGWISPEKFIPIAEESDLIHKIGEWALNHACHQIRKWLDSGFNPGTLSVNVSGKQFTLANFHNVASEILKNTNCPAENILLEITENFLMEESDAALATLNNLRELGLNIAIDDFGTGYSSLSYLKRLPINKIKLDKSFVRDLPSNTNAVAIARAILSMGKTLGFDVIAEGIENRDQNKFLLTEECKYGQGFYYAKPMSAAKLVMYASKNKIKYRK